MKPITKKVLVVDDEDELRELIATRFRIFGFEAIEASRRQEAAEILAQDPEIGLVVTDLSMEGGSGLELIKTCKAHDPFWPKLFVITGRIEESAEQCYALGADGFMHKPFDARELLHTIRAAMLSPRERLGVPQSSSPTLVLRDPSGIQIGRGGICVTVSAASAPANLRLGEVVGFHFATASPPLVGAGVVRWRRPSAQLGGLEFGLEFVSLDANSLTAWLKYCESARPLAYIPSTQIVASSPSKAKLQSTG